MKTSIKILLLIILIILVIIGFWYGISNNQITGKVIDEEQTIKIGAALALTGKYASIGENAKNSIDLAVEEANKKNDFNIEIIYEDTQSDPQFSVNAAKKLIEIDKVKVILGPLGSSNVLAIAPLTEENKVILFSPSASSVDITSAGDYVFRNRETSKLHGEKMAEFLANKGINKVAVFTAQSSNSLFYSKFFKEAFENEIVLSVEYAPETADFKTDILKAKEKGAEAFYLSITSGEDGGILVKQIKELGFEGIITCSVAAETQEFLDAAGSSAEGILFTSPSFNIENPNIKPYREKYKKRYGKESDFWAANAYDAVMLISNALKECGEDTDCIRDYLYSVKDYPGIAGLTSFDENGDVIKPITLKTIKDGKHTLYQQEEAVKIGVILPLSGTSSDAAQYIQEGLDLALKEINEDDSLKYTYELIYEDSQYVPATGVSALNKLIAIDRVNYVIGAYGSSTTLAVAPIAEEKKVILITPGSQSSKISESGDYIFRTQINTDQESKFFAEYLFGRIGTEKIDLVFLNTDYGESYVSGFSSRFEELGGNIGIVQKFDKSDQDYRTLLLKIKQEGNNYILIGATRKQAGSILKQAHELDLSNTFFATSVVEGEELINIGGPSAEGLIYPYPYDKTSDDPAMEEFREKYLAAYGRSNEMLAANGYDTLNLLSLCIEKVGDDVEKVKQCLYNTQNYQGASGLLSFDENGDVSKPFVFKTVKDGKFVPYEE